ncbi:MerR family transcriptional regulator [Rhodoplanes azumiensis]|uniref:MerR family transcriptional regulator n=1 Tax=Rhodoplanes azumiensis TaxID=1897628 RepID=A0ABW5ADT2_9BRAD
MNKAPEAFRTISEVAEELALPQHVLRFWESRFPQVRPMKRGGGRRYYRPDDVDLLRGIRHLLYGEGYTIRGVQRILREQGGRFVQTVWQEGAPQPERVPELDGTDAEGSEHEDAVAVALDPAEADESAESAASRDDTETPEPDLDTDPYGRREPSFGPPPGPASRPLQRTNHVPLARGEGAPVPPASAFAPPFAQPSAAPHVAPPVPPPGAAASLRETLRPITPEPEEVSDTPAVVRAAALPPPGLSAADRERLGAVLGELEACRRLLADALAEAGRAP